MTPAMIALLAAAILIVLLLMRVPVGFCLLAAGGIGLLLLDGPGMASIGLASEQYTAVARASLIVIPMFILMGMFAMHAGIAAGAFRLANNAFRKLPGGLGIATVVVCAVFAAVSGSSPATVATVGRMAIPEMRKAGYTREFTAGILGTAGCLGVLIPPSIVAVIFGIVTEVSIGRLLIAGILPGILTVLVLSAYVMVKVLRNPSLVSDRSYRPRAVAARAGGSRSRAGAADAEGIDEGVLPQPGAAEKKQRDGYALAGVAVMFTVVIGGIYTGIFTATESAAFGALIGFVILVIAKMRTGRFFSSFTDALRETAATTSMIFVIMIGAALFTNLLIRSGVTGSISSAILSWDLSPELLVIFTLLLMLPLGMFLEATSIIVITMPIMWPVLSAMGVDGVWFGIMTIVMIEIGLITPPVGINAFVLTGVAEDITLEQTFRGLLPFVFVQLFIVALLFAFPAISLFLPGLMRG